MRSKFHSVQKAFTLIELFIVIAIIGILMVAFLPTLRGGQQKARDAAKRALVGNIVTVLEQKINEGLSLPDEAGTPVGQGVCLDDYSTPPENIIAGWLGRVPESSTQIGDGGATHLCAGRAVWYNKIDANNYILAIEMENSSAGNANVSAVSNITANNSVTDVVNATTGAVPATGPWFYVIARQS